jgi:polysaccharide export outer membrane protein
MHAATYLQLKNLAMVVALITRLRAGLAAALFVFAHGIALAADMPLGPGDMLRISVYGSPDLSLDTRVSESGKITYPLIGEIDVGQLTAADAQDRIAALLTNGGYVKRPQVNIVVISLQSQQVSVLGNVNKPGRYPLEGKRSVVDMLALAGGINADGAETVLLVRQRNGKPLQETVDLGKLMRSADLTGEYDMRAGDVLYVERAPRFYIYGEVQRPGVYRLERNMTVVQALSTGGGLNIRGTERGLKIRRRGADGTMAMFDAKLDDPLQVDDVVYIKESLF